MRARQQFTCGARSARPSRASTLLCSSRGEQSEQVDARGRDRTDGEILGHIRRLRSGRGGPLLGPGRTGTIRPGDPADLRAHPAGDLARALDRACPGSAAHRHARVHAAGPGGLGVHAAAAAPGRRPTGLSREHTGQDCRRARRWQGRHGRTAAGNHRRPEGGSRRLDAAAGDRFAAGHRGAGDRCRVLRLQLAGAARRSTRDGGSGARSRHVHAARAARSARPAHRALRPGPTGDHDQSV